MKKKSTVVAIVGASFCATSFAASIAPEPSAATPDKPALATTAPASAPAPSAADAETRWLSRASLSEGTYSSGLSRGKLDLGVRFDAPVRTIRPGDAPVDPVLAYVAPAPTLSVGLRSTPAGTVATAGSLIERATGATIGPQPERKVGLEWKPAQSRIFLNRGVGIRLDGDDRVTMRLKKGSLGLFMKTVF